MTRLLRRSGVALLAVLFISLLVVPAVSLAKTPGWTMAVTSIPTTVSPGAFAAFRVTITNSGKSNVAKIYLTDSRPETPFSVTPSTGCKATGQLNCALGALGSGKSVTRVVVYKTPATGTSFAFTFEANTSGVSFSDGGTSHGDALKKDASTAMDGTGNFAGGYVIDAGSSFTTGSGDTQQTTVNAPKTGIGVTISEGVTGNGNPCSTGHTIGQLTNLNVDDGNVLPFFLTTITIPTSSIPNEELELSQVKLCHQYDGGAAVLLPQCAADVAPTSGPACFYPKFGGQYHPDHEFHGESDADDWSLLILDMWDTQNGGLRGGY